MAHSYLLAVATGALSVLAPLAVLAANTNPDEVQPGAYTVEPYHTRVLFSVDHLGFNDYFGEFSGIKGILKLDPNNASGSQVDVTIPVESLSLTNPQLESELRGADWFDAAKFPAIRFVSRQVTRTGPKSAKIIGDLTMHGVTKPVELDAVFNAAGVDPLDKAYTAGFSARGQIKRSDFGVSKYVPMIGDDVTLTVSAAFEKQPR